MKKLLLSAVGLLLLKAHLQAQAPAADVFKLLKSMPDQRDQNIDPASFDDEMVIIFVPGANDPFQKFYTKKKAANLQPNAVLVGGFKEMMGGMSMVFKKKHLQEALAMRYKGDSRVFLDLDSELASLLSTQGYAIIRLSRKQNKVLEINDFGFDRVSFFKALKSYELNNQKEGTDD